ncbi:glycosyltransferase family 39 protein [Ornithinibacter aureus]|uniref:glycosyltransferase family 39 protein n=1 Tax=Ornithinibacter aureus TaxID=622664 RepID=UPI00135BEF27|nr:glycosyltransferase family 39 protein [Ornithinibacter aureus]
MPTTRQPFASRGVALVAAAVGVVLLALSGRYGYHRDELYFVAAGKHLAWGYPDQPPLVPLLARLADLVAPGSLVALRLPSTLAAIAIVTLTAAIARELGAKREGQVIAASAAATCGLVLAMTHLLSTSTFGLLGWTLLTLLLVRILQDGATLGRWVAVGAVAGLTAQSNPLVGLLLVVLVAALAAVGPRQLLREPGLYVAGAIAVVVIAPYLFWQHTNGWPQLDVARGIANGESGSSEPRALFVPMQLLLVGPLLTPFWVVGLVRLLRMPSVRVLGATYLGLAALLLLLGGKPYYLAGLYPLLLAAGAQPVVYRIKVPACVALLGLSVPAVVFTLPVLPAAQAGIPVAVNYDVGETIGWPDLVKQVAATHRTLPEGTAIVAGNYGLAGAVDRYGPDLGLPPAHSGHMAYWLWGPPPDEADSVLAIGVDPDVLDDAFTTCREVGVLENRWGIDNDEDGTTMLACTGLTRPWVDNWPAFRRP